MHSTKGDILLRNKTAHVLAASLRCPSDDRQRIEVEKEIQVCKDQGGGGKDPSHEKTERQVRLCRLSCLKIKAEVLKSLKS